MESTQHFTIKLHVGFFKIIKNNSEYNDVKSDFFAIRNDGQFKLI